MALDIDVDFDFTTDNSYWRTYNRGHSDSDPDLNSPTLRLYQQKLYSRQTPSGINLVLKQGKSRNDDYLMCAGIRYGSDSIINMYAYQLPEIEKTIENYDKKIEEYIHKGYTIGGEIIFPKHRMSINQCRGINHSIKDRFDLTLECIRRFYAKQDSPLNDVFEKDEDFFDFFMDFKGYVDFFFLNDLVSNDYKKVKLFFGTDKDVFVRNPLPQNKKEWEQLFDRQMQFLEKRNERIRKFCLKH